MSARFLALVAATAVGLGAVTTACSDDEPSAEERLCEDRDALESSLRALRDVDIVAEGTSGVQAALSDVEEDLQALRDSASENFGDEVDALRDALDDLRTAVEGADGIRGLGPAVQAVASAGSALAESLQEVDCG